MTTANPANPPASAPAALAGVRVLDLSRVLAGPWATQILGDYGADVIKVERPGLGDDTRHWGPPFMPDADGDRGDATYFLCANRNKRAVALDLADPSDQAIARRLAAEADVLVENFKVGGLAAYGLDYAAVSAANAKLVYCSITGFGQTGPAAQEPGYDHLIQAMGGLMSITGAPRGQPMKAGVAIADLFTGMYAVSAILAALRHAEATGQGQHIDAALFDCQVAMLANQASAYLNGPSAPKRHGNAHPSIAPYEVYQARDGAMVIAVGNDRQFAALTGALGEPDRAKDARFATNPARVAHRRELNAWLAPALAAETRKHWRAVLSGAGVPCGPVNDLAEVFADPLTRARNLVTTQNDPDRGHVRLVNNPVKMSKTPPCTRLGPPKQPKREPERVIAWRPRPEPDAPATKGNRVSVEQSD